MSQLHVLQPLSVIESKLHKMKEIKQNLKELQAYHDKLKDEVIKDYFNDHAEYVTQHGLVLASYKEVEKMVFDVTSFKKDHIDVYNLYTKKQISKPFLLK